MSRDRELELYRKIQSLEKEIKVLKDELECLNKIKQMGEQVKVIKNHMRTVE